MIKLIILTKVHFNTDEDRHTVRQSEVFNSMASLTAEQWRGDIKAVAVNCPDGSAPDHGLSQIAEELWATLKIRDRAGTILPEDFRFEVAVTNFESGKGSWLNRTSTGGPLGGYELKSYISLK